MIEDPTSTLQELVQAPAVSGDEEEVADILLDILADTPFNTETIGDTVIAHHGTDGPLVALHAHIDTVPAEGDWTHPPTGPDAGVIEDGMLYGLGAADNKASVVSVLLAAEELLDHDIQLVLVFAAEEEVSGAGTQDALNWIKEQYDTTGAMAIVTEPTGLETVGTGCMGTLFLEVTAETDGGHAAMGPENPINAIMDLVAGPDADGGCSATITSIEADSGAPNQVPETAEAIVDVRTSPGTDQEDIIEMLADHGSISSVEHAADACPAAVCDDQDLIDAAVSVTGATPTVLETADDSCFFNAADIPAVVYGPGDMDQAHTVDECVDPQKVQKAAKDLIGIVEAWTP